MGIGGVTSNVWRFYCRRWGGYDGYKRGEQQRVTVLLPAVRRGNSNVWWVYCRGKEGVNSNVLRMCFQRWGGKNSSLWLIYYRRWDGGVLGVGGRGQWHVKGLPSAVKWDEWEWGEATVCAWRCYCRRWGGGEVACDGSTAGGEERAISISWCSMKLMWWVL